VSSSLAYTKAEILLKVSNLSVNYALPILRDVSFEIRDIQRPGLTQGQKVALLAPSGMGKTQLFKRIAGLEPPSSGTILIGPDQKPTRAGMVGVVPQNYLLFQHRTVGSSLLLAAGMREKDSKTAKAKVLAILEEFGLSDKFNTYPQELSGGQRQRVSIAEQLLSSNHFLLMDEPFSGLDILMKKRVCDVIDNVASRDELNTIIFSTHDVESAVMIADTILVLGRDPGVLHRMDGSTSQIGIIPGARIQANIDLIERDLAWQPDIERRPQFASTVAEIKALFPAL
jgi:polar amino acid transport system ATP-binding protein/sulfate transport system ATP-binding protein